jgi:hypothetical protein
MTLNRTSVILPNVPTQDREVCRPSCISVSTIVVAEAIATAEDIVEFIADSKLELWTAEDTVSGRDIMER